MNVQNNGGNTPLSKPLQGEFKDDAYWQELCEKTRYILPAYGVQATLVNIRIWLNRLDIKEVDYKEAMQTSVADMLKLNPTYPLRAMVGLLLEYKFTGTQSIA